MRISWLLCLMIALAHAFVVLADGERDNHPEEVRRVPRVGVDVPADREHALRQGLQALQKKISELHGRKDRQVANLLPDVMIFERAVRCALDFKELFSPKDIDKADAVLAEGLSRADQLLSGNPEWPTQTGLIVRGYTSRLDNTVQPYGLVIPPTYDTRHGTPTRCDLWFHGRGETLSEVNFIWDRMKNAGRYTPDRTIVLHSYGRYSNAFKFAGEVDVLEGLQDVQSRYGIDPKRISVRGFSMGGAACWQFAVHYADRWFAANPGAGFSETPEFLKFFQKETLNPKPWERRLWNLYDCNQYAVNLRHCPTIAYSGENDIQKQAADVMEAALTKRGIRLRHIIGADMGHSIDEDSMRVIEAGMNSLAAELPRTAPRHVRLETFTLKYHRMHWVTIDALDEHWKHAEIDARWEFADHEGSPQIEVGVGSSNVSAFSLNFPPGTFHSQNTGEADDQIRLVVSIGSAEGDGWQRVIGDGPFSDGSATLHVHRNESGRWTSGGAPESLRKRHNLQGPIDDALMDSFVFVRPTGKPANPLVGQWAESELTRAIEHWRRHFRGDARVVNDTEVTEDMIASANLILWGDPSSNAVISRVVGKLPIAWSEKSIDVGAHSFDAQSHAPILIYPNPLNQSRYVVLNSSFTYRDYAYLNNARQVPMLPDWAIVNLHTPPGNVWPGEVVAADFFDETWQLKR